MWRLRLCLAWPPCRAQFCINKNKSIYRVGTHFVSVKHMLAGTCKPDLQPAIPDVKDVGINRQQVSNKFSVPAANGTNSECAGPFACTAVLNITVSSMRTLRCFWCPATVICLVVLA